MHWMTLEVIQRDDFMPYWVGTTNAPSGRHDTVELLKCLRKLAGLDDDKIRISTDPCMNEDEFLAAVIEKRNIYERNAYRKYDQPCDKDHVNIWLGTPENRVAAMNASLADTIWHLYQRMINDPTPKSPAR